MRAANLPFARLLGYESAAELQRLGEVLGIFAGPEELERVLRDRGERGDQRMGAVLFRRKDGSRQSFGVIGPACGSGWRRASRCSSGSRSRGGRAAAHRDRGREVRNRSYQLSAVRGTSPGIGVSVEDFRAVGS